MTPSLTLPRSTGGGSRRGGEEAGLWGGRDPHVTVMYDAPSVAPGADAAAWGRQTTGRGIA